MADPTWDDTEPTWEDTETIEEPIAIPGRSHARNLPEPEFREDYVEPEVSAASAAFQHAAPSATLGLSDIAAGVGGAAGYAAGEAEQGRLADLEGLKESYYGAKEDTAARRAKAMEEQPGASITGMVGGGFLTPIPGAALLKGGKATQAIGKLLPNLKGADKISKAGQLAEKAKRIGDMGKYYKLKKIQKAAASGLALKEGVKAGAITSGAMGESKLLEGDVQGFVEDVLYGGTVGGAVSLGFTKGIQGTGELIKRIPGVQSALDSFRFGSKGFSLDEAEVNHRINEAGKKYLKDFNDKLNKLGTTKEDALSMIDELGVTINGREDLLKAREVIKNIHSESHRKKAAQFLDVLDDYLGEGKAYKKIKNSLEKKIVKARYNDPIAEAKVKLQKKELKKAIESNQFPESVDDLGTVSSKDVLPGQGPEVQSQVQHSITQEMTPEGMVAKHQMSAQDVPGFSPSKIARSVEPETGREVALFKDFASGKTHAAVGEKAKLLNAEKLTSTEASKLKDLMNEYSVLAGKENLPRDVKRAATDAAKMINDKINGAAAKIGKPIDNINKKISNMLSAKERIGIGKEITSYDKEDALKAMSKFISGIGDKNPLDDKSLVLQRLRKVDPKIADDISKELQDLRRQYELTSKTGGDVGMGKLSVVIGAAQGVWTKAWNTLGQVSTAPIRVATSTGKALKTSLGNKTLDIIEASPAQLQGLINGIQKGSNKANKAFVGPLTKALKSKARQKNAILYGLSTQPAFREMVESLSEEDKE